MILGDFGHSMREFSSTLGTSPILVRSELILMTPAAPDFQSRSSANAYEEPLAFVSSLAILIFSIILVFYGFIGYYSRVTLISELQKDDKDANIDFLFLQIDQAERDETELNIRRTNIASLQNKINDQRSKMQFEAASSKEYVEYVTAAMAVLDLLYAAREIISDEYLGLINRADYAKPDFLQAELFSNPVYRQGISSDQKNDLYQKILPTIQNFRYKIVYYNTKYGGIISQVGNFEKSEIDNSRSAVREILTRHPQWASSDESATYGLKEITILSRDQATAQYRAIIGSYRKALGDASVILRWPTIVSTMVVTLATGLLGGVVSFMGLGEHVRSPDAENSQEARSQIIQLLRRCIFGVIAALVIFLLAGSGLLVLTAQSGKLISLGSIELSPYFVAFLAFISGFLSDDAFTRITGAGRTIFQTADDTSVRPK
jgi:hypothetical protein